MEHLEGSKPETWTIIRLKEFLKKHGIQSSKYTKTQLVAFAKAVLALNIERDPDFHEFDTMKKIEDKIGEVLGCAVNPWDMQDSRFSPDLSGSPVFSLYNIFNYLLCSRADFDNKKLKAYKSFDDYRLFFDGHVYQLEYCTFPRNCYLFRSKVKPTQRQKTNMNAQLYKCWFIIQDEDVMLAYCECPGGADGGCRHISASLYELESYQDKIKSCTDIAVQWRKRSRQNDEPTTLENIAIKKPRYGLISDASVVDLRSETDVRHPNDRSPTTQKKISEFCAKLRKIDPTASALDVLEKPEVVEDGGGVITDISNLQILTRLRNFTKGVADGVYDPETLYLEFVDNFAYNTSEQFQIDKSTRGQSRILLQPCLLLAFYSAHRIGC